MITGKNQIGYKLLAGSSVTFTTFDPVRNEANPWKFSEASEEEVQMALELASKAFREYRLMPDEVRASFLREIALELEAAKGKLFDIFSRESGLGLARAQAELKRTLFQLESFADYILTKDWRRQSTDPAIPDRSPVPKPDLRKTSIPLGPVVVFGSSNFPFAYSTAGGDTASALAAGCPVIVKSHPMHAGTGELVAAAVSRAAKSAGVPDGTFSNLNSIGFHVGTSLVSDNRVKAVGFTGSLAGGRALFDLANRREVPIPVFAEMGSVNPVIISPGSLKLHSEAIAGQFAESITQGTGQFCTNPGLLLSLDSPELDIFAQKLAAKIDALPATSMLHPDIYRKYRSGREKAMMQSGIAVLTKEEQVQPNFGEKTLLMVDGQFFSDHPGLHHEVFGPFSIIVKCRNIKELEQIVDQLEGQLTGTIHLLDEEKDTFWDLIEQLSLKVGRLIFNGAPTGVEVCPSMTHGGPYPATTDSRFTAVGVNAIYRWLRPVTYQNFPSDLLPHELR